MDLLSKLNPLKHDTSATASGLPGARVHPAPLSESVNALTRRYEQLWWGCDRSTPAFSKAYTPQEQAANEKKLEKLVDGLTYELKHLPASGAARQAVQERLRGGAVDFARCALNLEQRHIEFLEKSGMIEAVQGFARQARVFDPAISGDDIYQAARNVMSANFIQILLGQQVAVTPSIFAYSMLYPYTDNYLDDPAISAATKMAFNHRFQHRLMGEATRPANPHEEAISRLIEMIEGEWERQRFPQVYESLLAIHAGQARSLKLVSPGSSPYELDVLGISFEKGGTSVLADGCLVAGWLNPQQAAFLYGYGAFTQLMDDLEDVLTDRKEGRMSIFSQVAGHWPLDRLTDRMFHFGRAILSDLSAFDAPAAGPLKELIERSIDPVLIDTAGRVGNLYSREYLRRLEQHMPFRFAMMKKQREKLERQKVNLSRLMEAFFIEEAG